MIRKRHTYAFSKMLQWKVTFYQNVSVRNFLGAFLTIILVLRQRSHSWNVFAHTMAFILGASNPARTTVQTAGQEKSAKSNDKKPTKPMTKVRSQELKWLGGWIKNGLFYLDISGNEIGSFRYLWKIFFKRKSCLTETYLEPCKISMIRLFTK